MRKFKKGTVVAIPCTVQPGAFPMEKLVSIQSLFGIITGFVPSDSQSYVQGDQGYIRGIVRKVQADKVLVEMKGSFFTTTGLAELEPKWAASNLRVA